MKNTEKSYFENLETKNITGNRSFWRTVLPLLTQNSSKDEKISLVDDGKTNSSDEELSEAFSHFFSNVVHTLNISKPKPGKSSPMTNENLAIMSVINSFDKHLRIVKIKAKALHSTFHFRKTSCNGVEKIISNLNIKKAS